MIDLRGLTVALLFRPSSICRCKWKVGKRSGQTIWAWNMYIYDYTCISINRDTCKLCSFWFQSQWRQGKGVMANGLGKGLTLSIECQVQIFGCIGRTCLVPYHFMKVGGLLPFYLLLWEETYWFIGYLYLIKQQRQDNDFTLTLWHVFWFVTNYFYVHCFFQF